MERVQKKQKKKHLQERSSTEQSALSAPLPAPSQELTIRKPSKLTDLANGIVGKRKPTIDGHAGGAASKKLKVSGISAIEQDDPEDREIARLEKLLGVKRDNGKDAFIFISVLVCFFHIRSSWKK